MTDPPTPNKLGIVALTAFEALALGGSAGVYLSLNPPQSYWLGQLAGFAAIYALAFLAGAIAQAKAPQ